LGNEGFAAYFADLGIFLISESTGRERLVALSLDDADVATTADSRRP
jgi:hypothetical protein